MIAVPQPSAQTVAALRRALDKDWLDAADLRLIELLASRAGEADADALSLVIAAMCRACAEGSLCLPLQGEDLGGVLRDFLSAGGTGVGEPSEKAAETPPAKALAARFLSDLAAGRLDDICTRVHAHETASAPKPFIAAHGNLYFHRHWHALNQISGALRERAGAGSPVDSRADEADKGIDRDAYIRDVLHETLTLNPLRGSGPDATTLQLAQRQRWALAAALRERVFVLSGGPGTGKTTWTASWLRALLRLPGVKPERVRLCAPTGRAAQRLQESLRAGLESAAPSGTKGPDATARDLPVTTLHTLLGYQPYSGRYARGPEDPLDADWVLVDEASMVDVFLLAALTRALNPGARLLLVGDADQLPPVDAGAVLGELLPDDRLPRLSPAARGIIASVFPEDAGNLPAADANTICVPSMMLDFSHRASGDVVPLAAALREGDADTVLRLLGDALAPENAANATVRPLARIEPGKSDRGSTALSATLNAFADAAYVRKRVEGKTCTEWLGAFRTAHREDEAGIVKRLWEFVAAARVLAPLRRGTCSAENANRILRARLEPLWSRRGDAPGQGFHGAPVLISRNDRGTGLSNGEVGLWLEAAGGPVVFFPRPEPLEWLRLPVTQLPAHEPGFAVTVHKSQGSEYDEVLVILPEAGNRLLARETLYTAVTRARTKVRIFGTEQAIREAVDKTLRRSGGLRGMMEQE